MVLLKACYFLPHCQNYVIALAQGNYKKFCELHGMCKIKKKTLSSIGRQVCLSYIGLEQSLTHWRLDYHCNQRYISSNERKQRCCISIDQCINLIHGKVLECIVRFQRFLNENDVLAVSRKILKKQFVWKYFSRDGVISNWSVTR